MWVCVCVLKTDRQTDRQTFSHDVAIMRIWLCIFSSSKLTSHTASLRWRFIFVSTSFSSFFPFYFPLHAEQTQSRIVDGKCIILFICVKTEKLAEINCYNMKLQCWKCLVILLIYLWFVCMYVHISTQACQYGPQGKKKPNPLTIRKKSFKNRCGWVGAGHSVVNTVGEDHHWQQRQWTDGAACGWWTCF